MCGIVGAFDLRGKRSFDLEVIKRMLKAISHRGPDEQGHLLEPGIALGTCRLSIRDIQHGQQPFLDTTKNLVVSFNGEIYDNEILRDKLQKMNYQFRTQCDTETWLHLYHAYGLKLFEQVKGQFAFALWDKNNNTLILARDRVGICPLFYTEHDGWLIWSSEIKGILSAKLIEPEPDLIGIDNIIQTMTSIGSRTTFKNIKALLPGHYMEVKHHAQTIKQYWDFSFPRAGEELSGSTKNIIDEFDNLLQIATKRRLVADVEIASYLSAGVDSSTVLAIADSINQHMHAFTVQLTANVGVDELSQARETAAYVGSPLNWATISPQDILNHYPELIMAAEVPVLDTSSAALLQLAKLLKQNNIKVVLTGEGADEALAGYSWFKYQKIFNLISKLSTSPLQCLRLHTLRKINKDLPNLPPFAALQHTRIAQQNVFELLGMSRLFYYSPMMQTFAKDNDIYQDSGLFHTDFKNWHPLNQSIYIGYKTLLAGHLLIGKGDRLTMNASVEGRYPFLDEDVIQFCSQISPHFKLHYLTEKWLLRQVAKKYLPRDVANRPKGMFIANRASLFLNSNRPVWVDELLSPESLNQAGYFSPLGVAYLIKELKLLPETAITRNYKQLSLSHGLVSVVATQLWHHTFLGGNLCSLPAWQPPIA